MKDEEMAEEYCNHLQSEMLAYTPENPRQQRTVSLLDVEEAFLTGLKAGRQDDQLTKAKEIIKTLSDIVSKSDSEDYFKRDMVKAVEEAEQFLKEIEK